MPNSIVINFSIIVSVAVFTAIGLIACDATDTSISDNSNSADTKLLNDGIKNRAVTVYLVPEQDYSFVPVFNDRVVLAEPVYTVPVDMARGTATVDGTEVVYVGESCEVLQVTYPDIHDCVQEETAEFTYGDVEATVATDNEGSASLRLGDAENYRVRVKSWVTEEDAKCFWGGSETLGATETEVSIPVLVFCE